LAERRRVLWVVLGSAAGVILLVLGLILWFAFGSSPPPTTAPRAPERPTYVVGRAKKPGTVQFQSLGAAVATAKRAGLGARILVQDDLIEGPVLIDFPNVSIESEGDRQIVWKPASLPPPAPGQALTKLLTVNSAEGFRLKGITLDGDGQMGALINLFGRCPGVVLENLTLKRFTKYGIWVTNCEGGPAPDRHVKLLNIRFDAQPGQTALFFEVLDHYKDQFPKDRFFTVRDCAFPGPGDKVKAAKLTDLEQVELPTGVPVTEGS
jgi:hypothetical protein